MMRCAPSLQRCSSAAAPNQLRHRGLSAGCCRPMAVQRGTHVRVCAFRDAPGSALHASSHQEPAALPSTLVPAFERESDPPASQAVQSTASAAGQTEGSGAAQQAAGAAAQLPAGEGQRHAGRQHNQHNQHSHKHHNHRDGAASNIVPGRIRSGKPSGSSGSAGTGKAAGGGSGGNSRSKASISGSNSTSRAGGGGQQHELHEMVAGQASVQVKVVGHNSGGLLVKCGQREGFIPTRLLRLTPEQQRASRSALVGTTLTARAVKGMHSNHEVLFTTCFPDHPMWHRMRSLRDSRQTITVTVLQACGPTGVCVECGPDAVGFIPSRYLGPYFADGLGATVDDRGQRQQGEGRGAAPATAGGEGRRQPAERANGTMNVSSALSNEVSGASIESSGASKMASAASNEAAASGRSPFQWMVGRAMEAVVVTAEPETNTLTLSNSHVPQGRYMSTLLREGRPIRVRVWDIVPGGLEVEAKPYGFGPVGFVAYRDLEPSLHGAPMVSLLGCEMDVVVSEAVSDAQGWVVRLGFSGRKAAAAAVRRAAAATAAAAVQRAAAAAATAGGVAAAAAAISSAAAAPAAATAGGVAAAAVGGVVEAEAAGDAALETSATARQPGVASATGHAPPSALAAPPPAATLRALPAILPRIASPSQPVPPPSSKLPPSPALPPASVLPSPSLLPPAPVQPPAFVMPQAQVEGVFWRRLQQLCEEDAVVEVEVLRLCGGGGLAVKVWQFEGHMSLHQCGKALHKGFEEVKPGSTLQVLLMTVDPENRTFTCSRQALLLGELRREVRTRSAALAARWESGVDEGQAVQEGRVVHGCVLSVHPHSVLLNLGGGRRGVLGDVELSSSLHVNNLHAVFRPGDHVQLMVLSVSKGASINPQSPALGSPHKCGTASEPQQQHGGYGQRRGRAGATLHKQPQSRSYDQGQRGGRGEGAWQGRGDHQGDRWGGSAPGGHRGGRQAGQRGGQQEGQHLHVQLSLRRLEQQPGEMLLQPGAVLDRAAALAQPHA